MTATNRLRGGVQEGSGRVHVAGILHCFEWGFGERYAFAWVRSECLPLPLVSVATSKKVLDGMKVLDRRVVIALPTTSRTCLVAP